MLRRLCQVSLSSWTKLRARAEVQTEALWSNMSDVAPLTAHGCCLLLKEVRGCPLWLSVVSWREETLSPVYSVMDFPLLQVRCDDASWISAPAASYKWFVCPSTFCLIKSVTAVFIWQKMLYQVLFLLDLPLQKISEKYIDCSSGFAGEGFRIWSTFFCHMKIKSTRKKILKKYLWMRGFEETLFPQLFIVIHEYWKQTSHDDIFQFAFVFID